MKTVTFTINSTISLSDREIMEEILLAETRMNSGSKLKFFIKENPSRAEELENKIEAYKFVCQVADVPDFIIANPEVVKPDPLTSEDIKWAKEKISEFRDK